MIPQRQIKWAEMWRGAAEMLFDESDALAEIIDTTRREAPRWQPPAGPIDSILDDINRMEFLAETMERIAEEDYDDHPHAPRPYDPWQRIDAIVSAGDDLYFAGITQAGADRLADAVDWLAAMFDR